MTWCTKEHLPSVQVDMGVFYQSMAVLHKNHDEAESRVSLPVQLNLSSGHADSSDGRLVLSNVITWFFLLRN